MTYRELTEALARLSTDPRVHPNTRVDVQMRIESFEYYDTIEETPICAFGSEREPLLSISLDGSLVLSAASERNAVAR